jgi:hypothetical protein
MINKANKIKCIVVLVGLACCAGSIFAAAEARPRQRDVARDYFIEGPVGIPDLVNIFEQYVELTCADLGIDGKSFSVGGVGDFEVATIDLHSQDTWQNVLQQIQDKTGVNFAVNYEGNPDEHAVLMYFRSLPPFIVINDLQTLENAIETPAYTIIGLGVENKVTGELRPGWWY